MNNSDAYDFFTEHKHESIRFLSQSFIFQHGLEEDQLDNYRKKFSNMLTDREKYRKDQALKPAMAYAFAQFPVSQFAQKNY